MIELGGSAVHPWECDVMRHLNIQFYVERATEALVGLAVKLGLGPKTMTAAGVTLEATDQHMRLLRELRQGWIYSMRGGVVAMDARRLIFYCEITNAQTGQLAAAIRTECRLKQIASQLDAPFPAAAIAAAETFKVEIPAHGQARGMKLAPPAPAMTLAQAEARGLVPTYGGVTRPQECDAFGYLQPRFVMSNVTYAISHLLLPQGVAEPEAPVGGGTVENRLVFHKYPRAGDVLTMRSAISALEEKTYSWMHFLFDAETGEQLAANESVVVTMDMETRKSIAIPEHFRRRLAVRLVAGLMV